MDTVSNKDLRILHELIEEAKERSDGQNRPFNMIGCDTTLHGFINGYLEGYWNGLRIAESIINPKGSINDYDIPFHGIRSKLLEDAENRFINLRKELIENNIYPKEDTKLYQKPHDL